MNLDEPAMPTARNGSLVNSGFTQREYAAIHLCIPDSGNDELDAMIRRAQRERLAGQAMQAYVHAHAISHTFGREPECATQCYKLADALIAAGEVKHE